MHTNSHPDTDERTDPTGTSPSDNPRSLRELLLAAREEDGLTITKMSQQIGYSTSVLSQYLTGIYPGDTDRFERRAADWLRARDRKKRIGVKLIESEATRTVMAALETIRRTNDVGVIYGDAGIGKTSGIALYLEENPTCVEISLSRWARNDAQIERLIFGAMDSGAWKGNTPRAEFIVSKLRGSNRLLIVDNAHKATAAGLEWLFDLHDETRIPIALVGNEEVIRPIQANDQRFSRVGLKQPVTVSKPRALVKHLVQSVAPQFLGQVETLLEQVAEQHGRFRAVTKGLSLSATLAEAGGLDPISAVKAAHQRLVRHYELA
jgi:DNA transposition AAA+ family ATPase